MSIRNVRALDLLKLAGSVAALIVVVAAFMWISRSCDGESESDLDKYFLRDAATVEALGLPVYWLGREFTVDGLVFRGPEVAKFGAEVEGGGIHMDYLASVDGGNTGMELTIYSRDAWGLVEDSMMNPGLPGVTRRAVTVGGREGELLFLPLDTRPLNVLRLVLDFGDVVVVAVARAGGAVYPGGPDYSPFINNPDLLPQVMEDLRPYPQ